MKRQIPMRSAQPWSTVEDNKLRKQFEAGTPIAEMADALSRSSAGVYARLITLGKLKPDKSVTEEDPRALIEEALAYEAEAFEADEEISGADLVAWFTEWRERAKKAIDR